MVKKAVLGLFLAVFAMASQADAAAMLFKLTGFTGGSFGSGTFDNSTFWLELNATDAPATAIGGTAISTSLSGRLFKVGPTWASDDANWAINGGAANNKITFRDGGAGFEDDLRFDVTFVNGQRLRFGYLYDDVVSQGNAITTSNMYKFIFDNNPVANFENFSGFTPQGGDVTAIPEPGSMAVLGLMSAGLGGFVVRRRMKKTSAAS